MTILGDWRTRVELLVELGLRGSAVGGFQWDVSNWDAGAGWSGLEPTFIPLEPSELAGLTTQRGRSSGAGRHRTGTAQVDLIWTAPEGRWLFRPTSPVKIGQEMRIQARLDGSSELLPIYRGTVRDLVDRWDPDGPYSIRIGLSDRKADLAAVDLPERPVEGLDDLTSQRLDRILGLAGISAFYERFAAGVVHHQSSNFARNLLDEAEVTVEGEVGDFYVDREGFFVLKGREWYLSEPRSTDPQLTWTNVLGDDLAASPQAFATGQSLDDLVNQVTMARAGGTAYTAGPDTDSKISFGLRTYQRMDLTVRYDADVEWAADNRLAQLKDRTDRLDKVSAELNPTASSEALRRLLDVELGDLHELFWDDGSGSPFDDAYHVQGVSHRVTPSRWSVSVDLWHYAGAELPPEVALWGSGTWGESTWV